MRRSGHRQGRQPAHECSIARSLIDRVRAEALSRGALAVRRIEVRIGEMAGVARGFLVPAYDIFLGGALCRGAELRVTPVEIRWVSPGFSRTIPRGEVLRCEGCHPPARLDGGDEILLERSEMEVP